MEINDKNELLEVAKKVGKMIESVKGGFATQYLTVDRFVDGEYESSKIRVSNHKSNPSRMNDNDISFLVEVEEKEDTSEDCDYSPMHINKKNFSSSKNQFEITEDGLVDDGFSEVSIQAFLEDFFKIA